MAWLEKRNHKWFIAWREGEHTRRAGGDNGGWTDKQVARQKLAEFERITERGEAGLVDPFKAERKRPLAEHITDWVAHLRSMGRDAKYVQNCELRMNKLVKAIGWKLLGNITADSFCRWRQRIPVHTAGKLKGLPTVGPVTQNQYLDTVRAFCNWCVTPGGRMAFNPVKALPKIDTTGDIRRERRALSEAEIDTLLNLEGMSDEHKRSYRFMLATGLRRQETQDLVWSDLHLDCVTPYVKLRAKATKARRADSLPLMQQVADDLKAHRGAAGDGDKVFALDSIPTIEEHRGYLEQAGIDWEDDQGRRADVHAMRHTFGTMLSKAGVSPREAMELMRHSDLRLTMKVYTDPRIFDLAGAMAKLPIPGNRAEVQEQRATGTVDPCAKPNESLTLKVAHRVANETAGRPTMAQHGTSGNDDDSRNPLNDGQQCAQRHTLALTNENSAGRTRTYQNDAKTPENVGVSHDQGSTQGSTDLNLHRIIEAWPSVPPGLRAGIADLVERSAKARASRTAATQRGDKH